MENQESSKWCVPAHITGLFQIVANEDPLKMGSRGAGFSIDEPIITQAFYQKTKKNSLEVYFNDVRIDGKVTENVANNFRDYWTNQGLILQHHSKLPMQAGFGTSGAGAIGTAFALNELFNTNFDRITLGQMAHKAEVENRSGLGDVIAQMKGGAEIRLQPGAPGIGEIISFNWSKDIHVLSIFLGTISTKKIITSKKHIEDINNASGKLLSKLSSTSSVKDFADASYSFSKEIELMNKPVERMITILREKGYQASMIMIGESIFVAGKKEELIKCLEIIKTNDPKIPYWINQISDIGPSKM
ncbi:MAG: pantoate kinase [Candidatus Thorarchaeota archaeon]